MRRCLALTIVPALLFTSAPSEAQQLEATASAACNFASSSLGSQGQRQIQINLASSENYSFGEVYGQVYFDFRRKGVPQGPDSWFGGFRTALVNTGLFTENREYVLIATAFANLFDRATSQNRRTEIGKQILYRFKSGRDGNVQLLGTNIQTGSRKINTATEREGLFVLTPRYEVIEATNVVEIEFQFYKSKQTQINIGLFRTILTSLASVLGTAGVVTFPAQAAPAAVFDAVTKPIQDIGQVLSENFEPIDSLTRIKSIGFIPNVTVSFANVAAYSAEVPSGNQIIPYEIKVYAAVIPSIVANRLDETCKFPQYSPDPNSILRAAVTPSNVTVETYYKEDNLRRTYLSQLGRQAARDDLVEACNAIKEDIRRYFGGFDAYAIAWALFASRETQFKDKKAARDCFTSVERDITYNKLKLPKLWEVETEAVTSVSAPAAIPVTPAAIPVVRRVRQGSKP
jgi:hypothetical protein